MRLLSGIDYRNIKLACVVVAIFAAFPAGISLVAGLWLVAALSTPLFAVAVFVAFAMAFDEQRTELKQVQAAHAGYTQADFFRHFEAMGLRQEAIQGVWDSLQIWLPWVGFPLHPSDSLEHVLGMAVEDELEAIAMDCGCRWRPHDELEDIWPIETVEDLVVLVDRCYTDDPEIRKASWETPRSGLEQIVLVILSPFCILAIVGLLTAGPLWVLRRVDGADDAIVAANVAGAVAGIVVCLRLIYTSLASIPLNFSPPQRFAAASLATLLLIWLNVFAFLPLLAHHPDLHSPEGASLWLLLSVPVELLGVVLALRLLRLTAPA